MRNKTTFALFNGEGNLFAWSGNSALADDFVGACFDAGYDVDNYESQVATISLGEKLPEWDTYVQV